MKEFVLLTVLLTFLDFKQSHSFSVQKRGIQTHSDLQNALKVLQRKRRRVENSDLINRYGEVSDSYLPYDQLVPYGDAYNEENPDGLTDQYVLANMLNTYPDQYQDVSDNSKEQTDEPETPTLEELKQVFNEVDAKDVKQSESKTSNSDSKPAKGKNEKISQKQLDQLLSEAVKVPSTNSKSENEPGKVDKPEPVSADELKDVFKEIKITEKLEDGNKSKIETISSGEILNSDQENSLSTKNKRMAKRDNSLDTKTDTKIDTNTDETLLNLVQENQELRGTVYRLKLIEYLEDKENDYLASALKDATLAQLRNTEEYLEDEYKEIQKALEIEQALQEIKESDPDGEVEANLEPESDIEQTEDKRSESPYEDNLGVWYEQPVSDQGDAQQRLEDFVKQYRQTYDLDNNDEPDEGSLPLELPVLPTEEDACPQLELLGSNCAVASLLEIDDEARDLCNRHEVCYVCGPTVGLSQHDCDGGFRSETVDRCGTSHCIQSGAEFLWFIKQDHKYTNSYLAQCDAPCVKKYIVGA